MSYAVLINWTEQSISRTAGRDVWGVIHILDKKAYIVFLFKGIWRDSLKIVKSKDVIVRAFS